MTEKAKLTLEAMTEKAQLTLEAMTEKAKLTLEAMTKKAKLTLEAMTKKVKLTLEAATDDDMRQFLTEAATDDDMRQFLMEVATGDDPDDSLVPGDDPDVDSLGSEEALPSKEAYSGFNICSVRRFAVPRQQTKPSRDMAVDISSSAEFIQPPVLFLIIATQYVVLAVKDCAVLSICHTGCDPPSAIFWEALHSASAIFWEALHPASAIFWEALHPASAIFVEALLFLLSAIFVEAHKSSRLSRRTIQVVFRGAHR